MHYAVPVRYEVCMPGRSYTLVKDWPPNSSPDLRTCVHMDKIIVLQHQSFRYELNRHMSTHTRFLDQAQTGDPVAVLAARQATE